jgi:hypothetical protein
MSDALRSFSQRLARWSLTLGPLATVLVATLTVTVNLHARQQAATVSVSRWSGTSDSEPVEFLLKFRGSRIEGSVGYKGRFPRGPYEVRGTVDQIGTLTLMEVTGVPWEGTLEGLRIFGKRYDSPFSVERVEILGPETRVLPPEREPTSKDWPTFAAQFREAVARRDRAVLTITMSRNFEYGSYGVGVEPEKAFRELDWAYPPPDKKTNWDVLLKAVRRPPVQGKPSVFGRPTRVFKDILCDGPPCRVQVWVTFSPDDDGYWRWLSMLFPGD